MTLKEKIATGWKHGSQYVIQGKGCNKSYVDNVVYKGRGLYSGLGFGCTLVFFEEHQIIDVILKQ